MYLCTFNPQMLSLDWVSELIDSLSGMQNEINDTALIKIFESSNRHKVDFGSPGFKLLWNREKDVNVEELHIRISQASDVIPKLLTAIPGALQYSE